MVAETSIRPIRSAKTREGAATVVVIGLSLQISRCAKTGIRDLIESSIDICMYIGNPYMEREIAPGVVLFVVFTCREEEEEEEEIIRLVSARTASAHERRTYEEAHRSTEKGQR